MLSVGNRVARLRGELEKHWAGWRDGLVGKCRIPTQCPFHECVCACVRGCTHTQSGGGEGGLDIRKDEKHSGLG